MAGLVLLAGCGGGDPPVQTAVVIETSADAVAPEVRRAYELAQLNVVGELCGDAFADSIELDGWEAADYSVAEGEQCTQEDVAEALEGVREAWQGTVAPSWELLQEAFSVYLRVLNRRVTEPESVSLEELQGYAQDVVDAYVALQGLLAAHGVDLPEVVR